MGEFKLDFTGIGVYKAGTSWIAACLGDHPAVCMAYGKETNFFLANPEPWVVSGLPFRRTYFNTSHYKEGPEWYKAKFRHHEPGQMYGEFSNAYMGDPESARLLQEHNPAMKLLCCFRNPVDMTYAGYYHISRVQPLPDSFEETLAAYPQLLDFARHHSNLQPFLARFPLDQIHFMFFEDIKKDPVAFYRGLCEFLAIDPTIVPEVVHRRVNPRTVLRSRWIRNLRGAISDFMGSTRTTREFREGLVRFGVAKLGLKILRWNEKPGVVPPMKPETRRRLVEMFREENLKLAELLGRDLSHWNECA